MKYLKLDTFPQPFFIPVRVKREIKTGRIACPHNTNEWYYKGYYYYCDRLKKFFKVLDVDLEKTPDGKYHTKSVLIIWEDGKLERTSPCLNRHKDLLLDVNGFWF